MGGLEAKGTGKFKSLVNDNHSFLCCLGITMVTQNRTKHNNDGGDMLSKMYNCGEIAERYSVKIITVWEWIRKKKLPAIRIGKEYRISEDDLKAFEDERRTTRRDEEEK